MLGEYVTILKRETLENPEGLEARPPQIQHHATDNPHHGSDGSESHGDDAEALAVLA